MKQEIEKILINRPDIKLKGISLFSSILFHILILFILVKISPSVRLYLFQEVAEVRIVSPEKIYLPQLDRLPDQPEKSGAVIQKTSMERATAIGGEGGSVIETEQGQVYLSNLSISRIVNRGEEGQPSSKLVSEFRLNTSSGSKSNFTLGVGHQDSETTDRIGRESENRLIIPGYSPDGLSNIRFHRIKSTRSAGGNRTGSQPQSSVTYPGSYDISPWVREVVDKIRNNWSIPPLRDSVAIGEVKILLVVEKDGRLLSLEILDSSDLPYFDETAMEAIRSSLPFPPLPESFPSEKLEAYLVFQFNE